MSILVGIGQLWGSAECLFWWELDNCGNLQNVYFCRNWTIVEICRMSILVGTGQLWRSAECLFW